MSTLFNDLYQGLQEAIDYEKGTGTAKVSTIRTYDIVPVKNYTNEEIKTIRQKACMTQTVFANFLGVSVKTVEAWERGRTHPTGPACRLMDILSTGKTDRLSFIKAV